MNILHLKYAVEVAKTGSLNKAAEKLFMAPPNLSRSIKELETDLGITIFERSQKGVTLTPEGEEFIGYAKSLLKQIDHIEGLYKDTASKKQRFSISVPRASYISDALVEFSNELGQEPVEIFYKETNSQRTINNILNHDYKLGIIRYAENYDKFFKTMLEEKGLAYEMVTEFSYKLVMSAECPLAKKENITFDDLTDYIEIAHADPYVPSLPLAKVVKEELPDNIERRIFIFERASQNDLLSRNKETFMWVSPIPEETLKKYNLVQVECVDNKKIYKDILIYKKGYKLTELDKKFITALCDAKRKNF
ncbi:MAG: LysR family transcriptional regulator [Clostridia bacterium]|nr:LysR family transcriptional regulator [Clostridia bacterium]